MCLTACIDGHAARAADEVKAESAITGTGSANSHQLGEGSPAKPPPEERSRKKQKTPTYDVMAHSPECGDNPVGPASSNSLRSVSSASKKKILEERKKQQLKHINDKLAKRHSNIPQRETHSAKISARFDGYPATNQKHSPQPELIRRMEGKKQQSACGSGQLNSGEMTQSSRLPLLSTESLTATDVSLSCVTTFTDEPKTESFLYDDPFPVTSNEDDLLNSESSFVPLALNDSVELLKLTQTTDYTSSRPQTSDSQDTEVNISSLFSSLDQAYGYSTFLEKSKLVSSLMGPSGLSEDKWHKPKLLIEGEKRGEHLVVDTLSSSSAVLPKDGKKVVRVQAYYRGYVTRKKFRVLLRRNKAATQIQSLWLESDFITTH